MTGSDPMACIACADPVACTGAMAGGDPGGTGSPTAPRQAVAPQARDLLRDDTLPWARR